MISQDITYILRCNTNDITTNTNKHYMHWIDYLVAFLKQTTSYGHDDTILIRCWNADMQLRVIANGTGLVGTIVFVYDVTSPFGCLMLGNLHTAIDCLRKGVCVRSQADGDESEWCINCTHAEGEDVMEVIPGSWSRCRYCVKSAGVHVNWLFEFIDAFWYFDNVSVIKLD